MYYAESSQALRVAVQKTAAAERSAYRVGICCSTRAGQSARRTSTIHSPTTEFAEAGRWRRVYVTYVGVYVRQRPAHRPALPITGGLHSCLRPWQLPGSRSCSRLWAPAIVSTLVRNLGIWEVLQRYSRVELSVHSEHRWCAMLRTCT